jgi:hypothetical protein
VISSDSLNLFYENSTLQFVPIDYFNYINYPLLGILCLTCFVFIKFKQLIFLRKHLNPNLIFAKQNLFYSVLIFNSVLVAFIAVVSSGFQLFAFLLFPFFSLISSIIIHQDVSFIKGINLMASLLNRQWSSFILGMFFSFSISWILFITIAYGTQYLFLENTLLWILTDNELTAGKIKLGISVFQSSMGFLFYITLNSIFNSLLFYTLKEVNTAENLITRIHLIKATK